MKILEIKNLYKTYTKSDKSLNKVYEDFNISIEKGSKFISITGPDGAGKSTLLKLISGVIRQDKGQIKLGEMTPDSNNADFTSNISYMSQDLGLYEELSVIDNLKLFSGLKGLNLKENIPYLEDLLDKVGLLKFKNREAGSLSGGMKQKLGATCAIATKPKFLILDEPTVGVDPISRKELWKIIEKYLQESDSVCIFSTAYLEEAEASDETLVINNGKLIVHGKPPEIIAKIADQTYSVEAKDYRKIARELMFKTVFYDKFSPILDISPREGRIEILSQKSKNQNQIKNFLDKNFKEDLKITKRKAILEDAYIALTSDFSIKRQADNLKADFDSNQTIIEVKEISKKFGSFTAVKDSSFVVKKGEIFGILGPNGAGKTTTFRMICALLTPSKGEVLIKGLNLATAKSNLRAKIGYVSQKFSLYKKLTCRQNLEYFGLSYGVEKSIIKDRIETMLNEFDLQNVKDELAENIPFGHQRNLSMAAALIHKPEILFLDESTSGADASARRFFWNRINALANGGMTVVVTTHFMEEAEYCDRFLIQEKGEVLVVGSTDEICSKNGKRISVKEAFEDRVLEFRKKEK